MNRNFFLLFIAIFIFVVIAITSNRDESVVVESQVSSEVAVETTSEIYVQVSGAVKKPGLYKMNDGDRYNDVLNKAQLNNGNMNCINLAQKLVDEENIIVPAKGDACPTSEGVSDGVVNINDASVYDLQSLSGIGASKAQAIIDYRTTNGSFTSKEQLLNVEGISESLYSDIQSQISLS